MNIQVKELTEAVYRAVSLGYERDYTTSEITELIMEAIENHPAPSLNGANEVEQVGVSPATQQSAAPDAVCAGELSVS